MRRFFDWLADRLRPWHDNGLSEELQFPEIPYAGFVRGSMCRGASFAAEGGLPIGVFGLIGVEYGRRAARAWRPRELFLMEDVSRAFHEVEEYRERGLAIDAVRFDRLVETLVHYFAYLGETRTKAEVRGLVHRYLDEHSVPDPELDPAAFFQVAVDHPLLEELRRINAELGERFPGVVSGPASLWDLGLSLDGELDASRYGHVTPINCRTFAHTGGDGVHFSLMIQDGAITAGSPAVMTVPLMGSFIVGETLFDFLCLGCRRGYFGLEELAYQLEETLDVYTNPDRPPPASSSSDEDREADERGRRLLDYLSTRLDLRPWTGAARFHELQATYGPMLRLPPL